MGMIHKDNNEVTTYHVSVDNAGHNYAITKEGENIHTEINFQNGAVKENGVNGITSEALLAILIHRTEVLNARFPCQENEDALTGLIGALDAFESRTKDRINRGVEGLEKK